MVTGKAFFKWSLLILVFQTMTISNTAIAEPLNLGDYYPFESGLAWTYLEDGLNSVSLSVLSGTEYINGNTTKVGLYTGGEFPGTKIYSSVDSNGLRRHKEFSPNVFIQGLGFRDITVIYNPPMKFANATANFGDIVNSSGTIDYIISGLGTYPLDYTSTSKFVGFENITVPLSTFLTIKIQNSITIDGYINGQYISVPVTAVIWVAKYVGTVKAIDTSEGVPTTKELTSINFQPFIKADFSANKTSGTAPQTINFSDLSDGNVSSWFWSFGDGSTSTLQNPTHTYTHSGNYSVNFTVSGLGNSATETKTDYIEITIPGVDINNDGVTDLTDAILALQIMSNIIPSDPFTKEADINDDGLIGFEEAIYALQVSADIR